MNPRLFFSCLLLFAAGATTNAESFHSVKVSQLDFVDETAELEEALRKEFHRFSGKRGPSVRSEAETYVAWAGDRDRFSRPQGEYEIVFRMENGESADGFVDLLVNDSDRMSEVVREFAFTFTPSEETVSTEERFQEIRSLEAASLARDHLPGTAWFRHVAGVENEQIVRPFRPGGDLSESFNIFSGGRAISENLALDRELILATGGVGGTVPISEIQGVTVAAIDWTSRLPEAEIKIDVLAMSVPEDQHAVFVKGLPELLRLTDRLEGDLLPSAQAFSVRSPFRKLVSRYRSQMGLDVPDFAVNFLPAQSVALTGGDPFFPQGTDIALLIESQTPELLYTGLLAVITEKAGKAGAEELETAGDDYAYRAFENADRSFSSHLWKMGDVIVVANSKSQFERLTAVAEGAASALGETDEFRFFRNRYPLADGQKAFVFLSDETIRRWAGPELRIAASRRTRAIAAMGKLTSQALAGEAIDNTFEPLLGETKWENGRITSEVFGTLGFLTPASELAITSATAREKDAYDRWRSRYESGWTQVFDPIAVSIRENEDGLAFDLSVIPLTAGSDYGDFIGLTGNARLGEKARWVSEESVMHLALAIDTQSETFREFSQMAINYLPGLSVNPFGWMTGDLSLELEKSLLWEADKMDEFERFLNLPLVVRIGSKNRMQLGLFMTGLRAELEKSAPDAMWWETRRRGEFSYVAVTSNEFGMGMSTAIYYAPVSGALLLSLTEEGLLRAMAREAHQLLEEEIAHLPPADQLRMETNPAFLAGLQGIFDNSSAAERLQEESWKALPILNEWHRRFPEKDGTKMQLVAYGEDIFCPGGKGYRWNEEAKTMESVAFGYPAAPRMEPTEMSGFLTFENVRTGLTFQDDGLRAVVELGEKPARIPTPQPTPGEGDGLLLAETKDLIPLEEGAVNRYVGMMAGFPMEMTATIRNLSDGEDGTRFEEVAEYRFDGEEEYSTTYFYRLDEGLVVEKWISSDMENDETEQLKLPAKLIAGEEIRAKFRLVRTYELDGERIDSNLVGNEVIRVVGKEDVTVPAGEFKDCIRVEVSAESLFDGRFYRGKTATWYHPEVGVVKYQTIDGEPEIIELESRTIP